jgi:hypothetical protein
VANAIDPTTLQPGATAAPATTPAPAPPQTVATPAPQAAPVGGMREVDRAFVAPAAPPPAPPAPAPVGGEREPGWLNERLAQAKKNGGAEAQSALLKELGVTDVAAAKAAIAAAAAAAEANKSELQKAQERATAAEAGAKRATELDAVVSRRATSEMEALTEAQRTTVVGLAGQDAARQLDTIDQLRRGGLITTVAPTPPPSPPAPPAPAGKPPVPAPASTTAAGAAPPPAGPNNVDHKAVYEAMSISNPVAAAHYLERYAKQIFPE